jgi:hypothetical protein
MNNLRKDIQSSKSTHRLWLYNRRIVSWLVTPLAIALAFAILYLPPFGREFALLIAAGMAVVLGYIFTGWHARILHFWFKLHLMIFDVAKYCEHEEARRAWFQKVRRWMERHGLTGRNANRLLYDRDDRSNLARTYGAVVRRATGRSHDAVAAASELVSQELRDKLSAIHDRLEEIPNFGRLLYFRNCCWLELLMRSLMFFLCLTAPRALEHAGELSQIKHAPAVGRGIDEPILVTTTPAN